jgi:hypothetical protein
MTRYRTTPEAGPGPVVTLGSRGNPSPPTIAEPKPGLSPTDLGNRVSRHALAALTSDAGGTGRGAAFDRPEDPRAP